MAGFMIDNMRGQTDYGKGGATRLRDLNYELAFGHISRRKLCTTKKNQK